MTDDTTTNNTNNKDALMEPLLAEDNNNNNNVVPDSSDIETPALPSDEPEETAAAFSVQTELWEMLQLGFPLAVSFFCRMGMASTDSAFVGHISNGHFTPETYLAAAVLSDMCASVFVAPPLAFNQVLNALVGQAMGSGNPKMAGIWLQQSMFWLTMGMLPCLVGFFYVEPILLALGFPEDVSRVAGTYAMYNVVWPIPNGLYQCMRFYFQAQGKPRPAMYNNIFFLFVNAFLNWTFVFGGPFRHLGFKGLGFIGAAISLSISRTMQGVVYYFYMFVYKKHHVNTWPDDGLSFSHHTWERTQEFMKQSLPNLGTLLFSVISGQATTVLLGRLGEGAIAASSALSTVSIPWSGTLSATTCTISGVRVGYHLGRGDGHAANKATWLVLHFITIVMVVVAVVFLPLQNWILQIATSDQEVLALSAKVVPAMLVGTYLNLLVNNITSGVFSGMGRPIIATILSFGFELPMSIGGVAIYILVFHGNLLGVYWWGAISGAIEIVVVLAILLASDWEHWANEARRRQEAPIEEDEDDDEEDTNNLYEPPEGEIAPLVATEQEETGV
eukprot:Nitzschia sp. Nitz4//scaffold27_size158506//28812//30488//NITZ4_002582-RA/size158506-processed-gene-0.6-mRNA-1//1//CDS//3329545434//3612//frame0